MPAIAVIENSMKNSSMTEDENGLVVKESILVEQLSPTSRSPLYDALQAIGMPAYGSYHPYIPDVLVKSRVPRVFAQNSRTQAWVDLVWKPKDSGQLSSPADAPRVRFSAFTRELQTFVDRDKKIIQASYKQGLFGSSKTFRGNVVDYKAMGTLEFDFVRGSDPSYLLNYFGRMNAAPWRGGEKYTWHFADLSIEKQKYNPYWNVHAAFIYDPETFVKTICYRDVNNNIPYDIDQPFDPYRTSPANGWSNALTLPETNFTTLGLPTGF